ncbi:MAG TPA: phenylalanine--tRNA ligase subunit beta [Flavisolibacter sp.]|nr:phenylalanine--tRNA ligase subunit beta [Flavisolibacter sp.]
MTISYKWLSEYLPVKIEPERLSRILTSVGLEVEKMETFEEIRGGLKGLVIGEVLQAEQHPNADKLKLTSVNVGGAEPLKVVCGAPNVSAGQKVVVAPVGATIFPLGGDALTMKVAKIRGVESYGMICAEDEIGLGTSHAGIMVLPETAVVGTPAEEYFKPYTDIIYEIGLTPNRMDAMSHWGVARDVCAYLSHHDKKEIKPVLPQNNFKVDKPTLKIDVTIENQEACKRYSGICLSNVQVKLSPKWLQERLKSIGLRPINNIVDITNFIQHETGQPLHAFDYNAIKDGKVIVKTLAEGTAFVTLDEKKRFLSSEDLMICNADEAMCIAGVFGGLHSGVTEQTTNLFLESAYFDPVYVRKTSFRHGLRTDAATRFEKGIDISNTVTAVKRAAMLIKEIAGGSIASEIVDVYPDPQPKKEVSIKYHYLKKLSGKNYHPDTVKNILQNLGFSMERESMDTLTVGVPFHKPDISLPADIVEEILRIDGLDSIEIPTNINISPSIEENYLGERLKEKISNVLTGLGFTEILTNSITNAAYFSEEELATVVRLLNNLSSELNVMRPSMLHTALEVVSFNNNRKNLNLKFFEFGQTYSTTDTGKYKETPHLCLYITGEITEANWKQKSTTSDIYYLKGITETVLAALGVKNISFSTSTTKDLQAAVEAEEQGEKLVVLGQVSNELASKFDIKQPVYFADFYWDTILKYASKKIQFKEIPKYPSVERDLAIVVPKSMTYHEIQQQVNKLKLKTLQDLRLFDVFESEKLGADKKSMAINFRFIDEEKTLTDKEIDTWMNRIMITLEKELNAEIRK